MGKFIDAGYPEDATAILLCELDGSTVDVGVQIEHVSSVFKTAGATELKVSQNEAERQRFWAGRKSAFPAMGRLSPDYYCMDGTIPRKHLAGILNTIETLSEEYGLPVGIVATQNTIPALAEAIVHHTQGLGARS